MRRSKGVPAAFKVAYDVKVSDCDIAEELVHKNLGNYRVNRDREFFSVSLKQAIAVLDEIADKNVSRTTEGGP